MGRRVFRCISEQCRQPESGTKNIYASSPAELACTICGTSFENDKTKFVELANIHLIIPDKNGTIKGMEGQYSCLCPDKTKPHPKHMTAEATAVTCEDCLAVMATLSEFQSDPLAL